MKEISSRMSPYILEVVRHLLESRVFVPRFCIWSFEKSFFSQSGGRSMKKEYQRRV